MNSFDIKKNSVVIVGFLIVKEIPCYVVYLIIAENIKNLKEGKYFASNELVFLSKSLS